MRNVERHIQSEVMVSKWQLPQALGLNDSESTDGELQKCIHVNPPSFVRSLRHFGIAENLRPGDEKNLRHLTVTSIFKKMRIFFAIRNQNANFVSLRVHSVLKLAT